MIKKEECEVFYDENLKEIYLTDDSCDDEEEIKGEVFLFFGSWGYCFFLFCLLKECLF